MFAPNVDWQEVPFRAMLSEHLPPPLRLDKPLKALNAAVVMGGWVTGLLGPWLLPEAAATAARHTFDRTFNSTRIEISPLTGNVVSLGAAIFALEGFLARSRCLHVQLGSWCRNRRSSDVARMTDVLTASGP